MRRSSQMTTQRRRSALIACSLDEREYNLRVCHDAIIRYRCDGKLQCIPSSIWLDGLLVNALMTFTICARCIRRVLVQARIVVCRTSRSRIEKTSSDYSRRSSIRLREWRHL